MFIIQVVIIGILLVFLILLLLTLILMAFPKLVNRQKKEKTEAKVNIAPKVKETVKTVVEDKTDDYTLISIITAAISAYRSENGENPGLSSFRVVAFKKTSNRKKI